MKIVSTIAIMLLIITACGEDETDLCFSFDERSCQTDLWMEGADMSASLDDRITLIDNYFTNAGLTPGRVIVDEDFHDVVCQACDVCPNGPRFFVSIRGAEAEDLDQFRLLNLEIISCGSF